MLLKLNFCFHFQGPSDCDDEVKEAAKLDIVDETKQDNKTPEKKPRKKKKAKNKGYLFLKSF